MFRTTDGTMRGTTRLRLAAPATVIVATLLATVGFVLSAINQAPPPLQGASQVVVVPGPVDEGLRYPGEITSAAIAPAGKTVAYGLDAANGQVWTADFPSGRHASLLSGNLGGHVVSLGWSHDGSSLAYVVMMEGKSSLHVQSIPTASVEGTFAFGVILDFRWNPHQDSIVLTAGESGSMNVYLLIMSSLTPLTDDGRVTSSSWSANGSSILFSRTEGGDTNLWILPIGGSPRQITNLSGISYQPTESNDGKIAFLSNSAGKWDVWVLQKGILTDITESASRFSEPAEIANNSGLLWSPDGAKLLVQGTDPRGVSHVYLIDLDGTVVAPTNGLLPLEQQIYAMTTYHTPTLSIAFQNSSLALSPAGWNSDGRAFLAIESGPRSFLLIVRFSPSQLRTNPYG